jgi:type VI secretion system protein ImpC
MSNSNKPGMGFEVNIRRASDKQPVASNNTDTPFCMAILGDFSGRFNQPPVDDKPLSKRKLIAVDRDNFDEVLAGFKLSFNISFGAEFSSPITIDIAELDDFHPDALYEKLEIFGKLRSIRRRLQNKSSFDAAASEIVGWLVMDTPPTQAAKSSPESNPGKGGSPANLLDDVLGSTQQSASELEYLTSPGGLDRLIKEIIAPYVEPSANPRQQEMIDAVDAATAEHMRQILHHPHFQNLEAAWRSVYFLISRIETGRDLKIFLLDVSKQELADDLAGDVTSSSMYKRFCEPAVNDIPWSLLVGNYTFEDKIDDVLLLAQIGSIAKNARAPFLAAAKETLAGCESFGLYPDADDWRYDIKPGVKTAWQALRADPVADYIGLALPGFLLRAPYGKKSRPIDAFAFEEMSDRGDAIHGCYLWGNAAFLKAEQLARAFADNHWAMHPGDANQIDGLPMYYYDDDGETVLMPCAEIYLTEKGGKKLTAQGLIAIWSVKEMDAVRSSDFNSLSSNGKSLQGRWVK